jgi:hypothetical protein
LGIATLLEADRARGMGWEGWSFVTPDGDAIEVSAMLHLYIPGQQVKVLGVFCEEK